MSTIATLTINGPLDTLAEIAGKLHDLYPDGIRTDISDEPAVDGWTVAAARALLDKLAPRQRTLIENVVHSGGSFDPAEMRGEDGGLRGLTGPISKWVNALIKQGVLEPGTRSPISTRYDTENRSYQKAKEMHMRSELVNIFRLALTS